MGMGMGNCVLPATQRRVGGGGGGLIDWLIDWLVVI